MRGLRFFAVLAGVIVCMVAYSQPGKNRLQYWGSPENYLNAQGTVILDLVNLTLDECPPSIKYSLERRQALTLLDAVLHETKYDDGQLVRDFIASRMDRVLNDLKKPLPSKKDVRIYKIYNDGFLIRSQAGIIAVDLNGRQGTLIPDSLMAKIVSRCDGLFITHIHEDHCDKNVIDLFSSMDKPVYVVGNYALSGKNVHLVRYDEPKEVSVTMGGEKIQVTVLPGHQDDLLNNIYIFTLPNGRSVAHLGDQYNEEDMPMIRNAKEYAKGLDVLIINCWSNHFNEYVAGFSPKVIVTGHEDELGHSIDHREAFWLTYYKMEEVYKISVPYVIMGWGEGFTFRP